LLKIAVYCLFGIFSLLLDLEKRLGGLVSSVELVDRPVLNIHYRAFNMVIVLARLGGVHGRSWKN